MHVVSKIRKSYSLKQETRVFKIDKTRIFDVLFSLFALILFAPIFLVISLMIKIKSPEGKIFFTQKRLGLNGKEFEVYKFRTMVPNAEAKLEELLACDEAVKQEYLTYRKLKHDVRIIKGIGTFLRKSSLDELPQFINVLLGTMSVVGPRPYMKAEFFEHSSKIVKKITSVKPGITGYWQVIPSRHDTTFNERVQNDLEYIKQKSLWLDLKIIFKTVWVMFLGRGK